MRECFVNCLAIHIGRDILVNVGREVRTGSITGQTQMRYVFKNLIGRVLVT